MEKESNSLPAIVCGPMVRRLTNDDLVIWLVTTLDSGLTLDLALYQSDEKRTKLAQYSVSTAKGDDQLTHHCIPIGQRAFVRLLHFRFAEPLLENTLVEYDLQCQSSGNKLAAIMPDLALNGAEKPQVLFKKKIDNLYHGSCRRPHFHSQDALSQIDIHLSREPILERPAMLMMAGDQIYADDVAGPLLVAIHQVINLLGLHSERLEGTLVENAEALYQHEHCYYQRIHLLPDEDANEKVEKWFFKGKKKPVFTSIHTDNHLITAAEVYAMYLLVWSPELWSFVDLDMHNVAPKFKEQYESEKVIIESFKQELPAVRRVFAHIPTYMIFDDHDVTDDWNLTRGWEQVVYGNAYSRRIIGNALLGYWLFQGLGNAPDAFSGLMPFANRCFSALEMQQQDDFITELLAFSNWDYVLPTEPKCVVLDTRTHRWRSEDGDNKPSGLMDWESLSRLQQELYDQENVMVISAAPIFGVKLIEAIQKIFTFFGKALMVDAENWMAHKGTAKVILETFLDKRTPDQITVLSGDVHYSFVYDVFLKGARDDQQARVIQVTCSGIKNAFPDKLIRFFDKLNQFLYGRWSLFNWFTKRRHLSIRPRKPSLHSGGTLANNAAISRVYFNADNNRVRVELYCHDETKVKFEKQT
ncbi:alkaline phosphatase family protein [Alteromonas sp. a30]|uniref:alkaline phosphatase family protein n=1 Tax=Alteromonas sp. a30 TaxID=2730917 RepID=UPI00227EAE11|nr:alkaline phosphatase family protein [Alteromonas sp. a30]MCY7295697.1 alkaline phosphatase family protein [Alteromonas sp. a30]